MRHILQFIKIKNINSPAESWHFLFLVKISVLVYKAINHKKYYSESQLAAIIVILATTISYSSNYISRRFIQANLNLGVRITSHPCRATYGFGIFHFSPNLSTEQDYIKETSATHTQNESIISLNMCIFINYNILNIMLSCTLFQLLTLEVSELTVEWTK